MSKYCNAVDCTACGWSYYYPEYYHKGWEIKYAWATAGVAKWWARLGDTRLHANSEKDLIKLVDQNGHEGFLKQGLKNFSRLLELSQHAKRLPPRRVFCEKPRSAC